MRNTKHNILKAGAGLFLKYSFNGTGINRILKESKVPKGSFYHFFSSKDDFALAVLDEQKERIRVLGQKYLQDSDLPYTERFVAYYTHLFKKMAEHDYCIGCLVGTFGQEVAALSPALRQSVDDGFSLLKNMLEEFIRNGQAAGEINPELNPETHASYMVAAMQGSIIMAKVEKSGKPLDVFISTSAQTLIVN